MSAPVTRRHLLHFLSLAGITATTSVLPIKANEVLSPVDRLKDHKNILSLLVGGTQNSKIGQLATQLATIFSKNLQDPAILPLHFTTGYDSVTASNLFDTRTSQDGTTALITSGSAIIAALSADPRVHFDYERWIPILTSLTPTVVIARQPFHNSIPDLLKNRTMKVGVSTIISKELPTLLAVELLQINTHPVVGLTTFTAGIEALRKREIDILQIDSPEGFAELPKLLQEGFHIFFSFENNPTYGPNFSSLYTKLPHYRMGNTLFEIWQTLALAARINLAMVLPMLTPSELVTKWRFYADKLVQDSDFLPIMQQNNMFVQSNLKSITTFAQLIPSTTATLALRRWLSLKLTQWENI